MVKIIDRQTLQKLLENNENCVLIDVLDFEEYRKYHLPGALNVPINENFADNIQKAVPNKDMCVVVYCANRQCSASARAAEQMQKLGYTNINEYADGKADWKMAGLEVTTGA